MYAYYQNLSDLSKAEAKGSRAVWKKERKEQLTLALQDAPAKEQEEMTLALCDVEHTGAIQDWVCLDIVSAATCGLCNNPKRPQ